MITIHARAKKIGAGYVPCFILRNAKGQVKGSIVPKGAAREYRTFATKAEAILDAGIIAHSVVRNNPSFRVA